MLRYLCGVDIGATNITVSIADINGFRSRVLQLTNRIGDELTVPKQVISLITICCERGGVDLSDIERIGISSAGPFRRIDGMIELESPNICGGLSGVEGRLPNDWRRIPLERYLEDRLPPLKIANDAVSGAKAERMFGAGKGVNNLVYVTWSTGIGTGAYVDGHLISGKNGNAPHGGHIHLLDGGARCGCGERGHLEGLSSGMAIGRSYGGGSTAEDVFRMYRRGDPEAVEIVHDAARHFGRGLASINALLDTELFMIGGSVFQNNADILLPLIKKEMEGSFSVLSDGVEIVPAVLGRYLGDIAGLSLVMDEDWIEAWAEKEPWVQGVETVIIE